MYLFSSILQCITKLFKIRIFNLRKDTVVFYGINIKLRTFSRNHPIAYLSCSFHPIHSCSSNSTTTKVYSQLNVTASYKFYSQNIIYISVVIVRVCLNNRNSTFCLLFLFPFSSLSPVA